MNLGKFLKMKIMLEL